MLPKIGSGIENIRVWARRFTRGGRATKEHEGGLFIGSADSGKCTANFYSLIVSCLRRQVNPREYLHWLFTKLPTVSAPNAGYFTPAAAAGLRTQGAPPAAVA